MARPVLCTPQQHRNYTFYQSGKTKSWSLIPHITWDDSKVSLQYSSTFTSNWEFAYLSLSAVLKAIQAITVVIIYISRIGTQKTTKDFAIKENIEIFYAKMEKECQKK